VGRTPTPTPAARRSVTPNATATPPPTAPSGWSRSATNPPAGLGLAPGSAAKGQSNYEEPSPIWDTAWARTTADFITYRPQLLARGKPPLVALIAVGHRAHRLAFAMLRSQRPFDADRWDRVVAGHRHRVDEQARHGDTAVSGPPVRRDLPAESTLTHAEASSN
jgi:hypothetical protein